MPTTFNVTMQKKLSLFKNINQTTQNRKGRSARHRTSECIHLSLAQWLCSRLCWLVLEVARRQNREQRITPVREMVASIILMLQSLNITRQNTTLTLSFPFLRQIDIYTPTVYYQIIRYSRKHGTRSKEIKVLQILLMLSTGHEKA